MLNGPCLTRLRRKNMRLESTHRLRLAVLKNGKVVLLQTSNPISRFVGNHHVHLHQSRGGTKCRRR